MAKIAFINYSNNPNQFVDHITKLRMDSVTGIDLRGEIKPSVYRPGSRHWSKTTLPWMAFGYNLTVSPLQMLTLYNAVANNGKMMRPYLVNEIREDGRLLKQLHPVVLKDSICSRLTIQQLQECLEGVVLEGTGKTLKSYRYQIAGKTGTALVANGNRGYADKIYQSSFAGYFPADNPQYSIIVVIKNKPHAANFYGASVAGPVFKEIADQIFSLKVSQPNNAPYELLRNDSGWYNYSGYTKDIKKVTGQLGVKVSNAVTNGRSNYSRMYKQGAESMISTQVISSRQMPSLSGMGLKDAVYLCENLGLKVVVRGKGKVVAQTLSAGQNISRGQTIIIQLN
jgi:cell division protein FtsI (penicillin-binding protein 3)